MRTNLVQTLKESAKRMNLNRIAKRVALIGLFISLGIGSAWGSTYYSQLKAEGSTGKGYVYASDNSDATPEYVATSESGKKSSSTSQQEDAYYAWVKAVRGNVFAGWNAKSGSPTITGSANPYTIKVKESNSNNGTNVGTITATWTTYTKVDVTYYPSADGTYSVTYQYDSYDSDTKTITTGDAEGLSRTITAVGGAQTLTAYHNDVITLQNTSGDLQGWYSDASCTIPLTGITNNGDGTYTYVVPASGTTTASVYAKYPHVDHYFGRLTASIADVSMPGGGTINISKDVAAGVYSNEPQTVDNESMGTTSQTYYLHAKPTDKRYVFRGWYKDAECTELVHPSATTEDYTYTFTASSTDSESPTLGNVYAAFDFNLYYMQVEVEPSTQGLGMVLVKGNNTTPDYAEYASYSEQFLYAYRGAPTANAYLYAKAKYGYKFSGWYTNEACSGSAISTSATYTYTATGSSTDPLNPNIIKLYAKFVEDASTINITYNLPDQTKGEYTASVLDIAEVNDEFVWTFTQVFTSEGKTSNTVNAQHKTDVLRLEAAPKTGYGVTSWTEGSTTKTTPSQIYQTSGNDAKTFSVAFGDAKPFMVCSSTSATSGTQYATLREALDNLGSNKMIRVVQNAYVPAGDYTIPNGVRLYILRADASASKGKSVERSQATVTAPTPYVTLTLGQGANIIVNGSGDIEVGAQIVGKAQDNTGTGAGCNGAISGTYGLIVMSEGSTITLNGTSILYAWGQITGKGRITANSGTTVYEIFQVTDWCGGSRAYACKSGASKYKIFPFSQYHIQNIEVPLRLKNGANEKLMAVIDGNNADDIPLVGTNNSSSMFRMNSSDAYIEKSYDKVNDRQVYRTGGKASINDFSMEVVITVSTESFILPLTNNMSVYIESGTTSITTNAIVNADARVYIAEGATLEMASGKSLYVYDSNDWLSGFVFNGKKIAPIRYSLPYATTNGTSSGTPIRTSVDDAVILVNGTLDMKGKLYTSSGNAKIYSTATGKVKFTNAVADANTTVYHLNTISGSSFAASVATTYNTTMYPAKLRNGDGSFVGTAGAAANDQFIYNKNMEQWMKNPKTVSWNANGGTTEATTMAYSEGQFLGALPAAYRDGYTLVGWYTTSDGGTKKEPTDKVTADATYYAHWTPCTYSITYKDQGNVAFTGTHVDSPTAHPTTYTFGTGTTLNAATKAGHTFDGWFKTPSCSGTAITSISASEHKNITLYAKWTQVVNTFRVTFHANGHGTDPAYQDVVEGGKATEPTAPTATGYTFGGWYKETGCSNAWNFSTDVVNANTDLYAKWTANSYYVRFNKNHDNATGTMSNETFTYDESKALTSNAFSRTGYTFAGWATTTDDPVTYSNGQSVSNLTSNNGATVDLYAKWTAVSPSDLSISSEGNKWDFCTGESMKLTVSGSNIAAEATYQWKKWNGSSWDNIAGATSVSYTTSMEGNKAGQYCCTVTNATGYAATASGVWVRVWQLHLDDSDIDFTNTGTGTGCNTAVALSSDTHYEFKLKDNNGGWFGLNSKTVTGTESAFALNGTGANVNITAGMTGNYTFTINYSDKNNPTIAITYPTANQAAGYDIYFDKSVITGWTSESTSDIFLRIGKSTNNKNNTTDSKVWTLVPGTDRFYTIKTLAYNGFEAWQIANNASWTGDGKSIYLVNTGDGYAITKATNFQKYVVDASGITIVPTTSNNTENGCNYWNVETHTGMWTHTATITTPTNGTITIANVAQSLAATATTADIPHRTILTITATPNSGYKCTSLKVNNATFTSGNTHILAADATIEATFEVEETGPVMDIVDWTWNGTNGGTLKLNLNGIPAAGWPYVINETSYTSNQRAADRTLTIPYTGSADAQLTIVVKKNGGDIYSSHSYTIPHVYETNANLEETNASERVIVVNNGTLTVVGNVSVKAIYVRPEAELVVNSGVTLTVEKLVLRTTEWKAASLEKMGNISATSVYYTRQVSDMKFHQFALPLSVSSTDDVFLSNNASCPYGKTWLLKSYSESSRAANGTGSGISNWIEVADKSSIAASVGYELYSGSAYYREFYFPVDLSQTGTTVRVAHTDGAAGATHAGWNALCSPLLGKYSQAAIDPSERLKVSFLREGGVYKQDVPTIIYPAVPFYYQAPTGRDLVFSSGVASLPSREWNKAVPTQWLQLTINNQEGTVLDKANIFTHPEKFAPEYESGYDVAKQSLEGGKALLYSELSCGKLAFAAVPDSLAETRIPLTAYAAAEGEYVFSMVENDYLGRLQYVFLHDTQTGLVVDLLERDCAVNLAQGTNAGRFYIQCVFAAEAPEISTGVNHLNTENDKAQKIIYNDKVYIIYQGRVYDMTGRQCELR